MVDSINRILYKEESPIREILEGFNVTVLFTEGQGFGLVVNDEGILTGVVSDGDIRRKLLEGINLDDPVSKVMKRDFVFAKEGLTTHQILRLFDSSIVNIPVLDDELRPVDLYCYSKLNVSTYSTPRIIRARAPVRISFSGGGTDMSYYFNETPSAVLSSTINKYCTASIIVRDDKEIHITSKDQDLTYSAKRFEEIRFGDDLDLIKAAVKIMQPNFGFELETFAEYEPGTGLGGSSSLVVSILGALNYFRNEQQLDIYQLSDLAYQTERIDMKILGGWQDQYAVTFGGFSWIEFRQNEVVVSPLNLLKDTQMELEYNLMLFRLGGKRSSSNIQKNQIKLLKSNKNKQKVFVKMVKLATKMKETLLKGEIKLFADLLHESWLLKREMHDSVTNAFVDDCYNTARKLGSLGGKLLGAGGSGYLLIYSSPFYQKNITEALYQKGAIRENFRFSPSGLEVWSTKR